MMRAAPPAVAGAGPRRGRCRRRCAVVTAAEDVAPAARTPAARSRSTSPSRASAPETALVVHDPTPAGLTLLRVSAGAATLDCTTIAVRPARTRLSDGDVQRRRRAAGAGQRCRRRIRRRCCSPIARRPRAAIVSNRASATLQRRLHARADRRRRRRCDRARRHRAKTAPPSVRPGDTLRWNITRHQHRPLPLDSFTVNDAIPGGATLARRRGRRRDLRDGEPAEDRARRQRRVVRRGTLTLQGQKLISMASYASRSMRASTRQRRRRRRHQRRDGDTASAAPAVASAPGDDGGADDGGAAHAAKARQPDVGARSAIWPRIRSR